MLAAALQAAGLRPGDAVATLLWNQATHWEAYFGVPLAGGIVHPLNLRLHPRQLARIVQDASDRMAIVDESLLETWQAIGRDDLAVITAPGEYERRLAAAGPVGTETLDGSEDAGAAMGYTSGTTGMPKGVIYSHRALVLHALTIALPDAMGLRESDCVLPLVPMFHANAWGIPHTATLVGCKQVLMSGPFDAVRVLDAMEREQVSFSAGVATVWQGLLEELERHPGRWRLRAGLRVNLGGAPAPESLFRRFDRHGIAVNMGWGMTEMSPVGAMNPLRGAPAAVAGPTPAEAEAARTRAGRILPLVEARATPAGGLEVRGAWVAEGYHGGHDPQAWTEDGWFRTGDVVRFDQRGLMEIVDREKDMIRSGGEWISSVALENALAGCDGIREAAVIAEFDSKWQERPLALVALTAGASADPEGWRRHLEQSFARWECPDRYLVVEELPRTATGKLDKRALRERYGKRK